VYLAVCGPKGLVIFGRLRPSSHIMPDHAGDRGNSVTWSWAPRDHFHIKQVRAFRLCSASEGAQPDGLIAVRRGVPVPPRHAAGQHR